MIPSTESEVFQTNFMSTLLTFTGKGSFPICCVVCHFLWCCCNSLMKASHSMIKTLELCLYLLFSQPQTLFKLSFRTPKAHLHLVLVLTLIFSVMYTVICFNVAILLLFTRYSFGQTPSAEGDHMIQSKASKQLPNGLCNEIVFSN